MQLYFDDGTFEVNSEVYSEVYSGTETVLVTETIVDCGSDRQLHETQTHLLWCSSGVLLTFILFDHVKI